MYAYSTNNKGKFLNSTPKGKKTWKQDNKKVTVSVQHSIINNRSLIIYSHPLLLLEETWLCGMKQFLNLLVLMVGNLDLETEGRSVGYGCSQRGWLQPSLQHAC